jgi:hypothetical protein
MKLDYKYIFQNLFLLPLIVTFSQVTFSQTTSPPSTIAPKYSNEFLAIGVGARALGMANAQTAIANDVTAGYWNPAGLLKIKEKYQASLMHAEYFGGIANYDYVGFATPINEDSHLGISVIRMGIDNIPDTRFLIDNSGRINYDNVGAFAEASYAFIFSYAHYSIVKGLSLGANAKVLHRTVGVFGNAWGVGFDIAAQYEYKKWQLGAIARDVTTTFNVWNYNSETVVDIFSKTGNEIPNNSYELTLPRLILEGGREINFGENVGALLTAGFTFTFDGKRNTWIQTNLLSGDFQAGMELNYKKMIFLRGGIGNFQRLENFDKTIYTQTQPSFGLGFNIKNFTIDYALTNAIRGTADNPTTFSHVFSVKAGFSDKKAKK